MPSTPIRAAIVGGGLGGLSAAIALLRQGIDVTVFEQADQLGEVGAGVFIYPNSLRMLERAGLGPALAGVGAPVGPGSEYYRMDGSVVGQVMTSDSAGTTGMYGMHRADLLGVFAAEVPSGRVRTGHRCVGFEQNADQATVHFANGARFSADLVIAADGIHSSLQKYVVEPSPPIYSGFRAYRGLLSMADLPGWRPRAHQVWMGEGKHFMVFPVRRGEMVNYVGFVPTKAETIESWSAPGDRDELAAAYAGWDSRVTGLLSKVTSCFWWGLYDRQPLARWSNGRLLLLGDAAHPMLPHLGQGANQAIEDGFALAIFLAGREASEVPAILPRHQAFRSARTDIVQAEARRNGQRYNSQYESLEQRDHEIAHAAELRAWFYDYDVGKSALEQAA